jgi:glycosyltransferase involved in cell wall biosynthesis
MQLRIAYLCGTMGWGGLEMNQLRNALWMKNRGHEVTIFCLGSSPTAIKAKEWELNTRFITKHRRYYDFIQAWRLIQSLRECQINHLIVRATGDMSLAASASFLSRRKIKTHYFMEMEFGAPKKQFFRTLRYSFFTSWNCPLEHLKKQVLENSRVDANKINVIPSGIDLTHVLNETKVESREKLGWTPDKIYFGLVGRFDVLKGHELVIEAMKQAENKNFEVFFVGERTKDNNNDYDEFIRKKVVESNLQNRVHFLPFQENPFRVFNALDFTLMTSDSETFGMVTLESMAQGTPVIGSNAGGTPELLNFGELGLLYQTKSAEDLAKKFDLAASGKVFFSSAELKKRASYFDSNKVCEMVEKLLLS